MFESEFADMCADKFSLEGLACTDPGTRIPIDNSGMSIVIHIGIWLCAMQKELWEEKNILEIKF